MDLNLYLHVVFYILTAQLSWCQEWAWLGGDTVIDRLSTDGYPGGRSGSGVWNSGGTVWMFGGKGFSDIGTGKSHLLNDVWSFNIHTRQFRLQNPGTWNSKSDPLLQSLNIPPGRQHVAMCGYLNKVFVFGGFGEGGVSLGDLWTYDTSTRNWLEHILSNDSSTVPSARGHSSTWCYKSSMFLFGGMNDNKTIFPDMWKLNLSSLTWTNLLAFDEANNLNSLSHPAARNGAATWISGGTFYMFGGNTNSSFSYTLQHIAGLTSDLWRYHLQNNTWQFVTDVIQPGQDSVDNLADSRQYSSSPGGRISSATWTDTDGNLWLFGGAGTDKNPVSLYHRAKLLSDVWMFDLYVHCWTFMGGSELGETSGRYGNFGKAAKTNLPGARTDMVVWEGGDNLAYIFGGIGHDKMQFGGHLNDLWSCDFAAIVSREYLVTPQILLSFFGVASLLLGVVLVFALCTKENQFRHRSRLQFKLSPEYCRLESDVA